MNNTNTKSVVMFFIILALAVISIACVESVAAQSAVYVYAESTGGEFEFVGNGDEWEWNIYVEGFDVADTDVTNNWGTSSNVIYENVGEGTIYMKVSHKLAGDEFWYFNWLKEDINGNGIYTKGLPGGHSVTVANSTNVTGHIDYRERDHKAVFLRDTRHHHADLTVVVHNGHLLENASVELIGGPQSVQWTDENGEAEFKPSTGKYAMLIESEGFNAMLVEDLVFESQNSYYIRVNMTDCLTSSGSAFCAPDANDLIMYYREKEPNMGPISPQNYTNFFAQQLTTCMVNSNPCADGTLEIMARKYGIFPNPTLGALLYSCNFTELRCDDTWCEYNVTFCVKNYQKDSYNYTVELIADDTITPMATGTLGPTFSTTAKEIVQKTVVVNCDNSMSGCGSRMYLKVTSEKVGD